MRGSKVATCRCHVCRGREGEGLQEEERDISCPSRRLLVCRHPLAHAATPEASMVRAGFLPLPPLISLPRCSREGRRHRTNRGSREGKGKWKNEYRFSKSLCTSGCRNPSPVGAPRLSSPAGLRQQCPFEHGVAGMEDPLSPACLGAGDFSTGLQIMLWWAGDVTPAGESCCASLRLMSNYGITAVGGGS